MGGGAGTSAGAGGAPGAGAGGAAGSGGSTSAGGSGSGAAGTGASAGAAFGGRGGTGGAAGAAAGSAAGGSSGGGSSCTGSTLVKGDTNRKTMVGSASRSYILHVPTSYTGTTPVPFIIDFHPLGGTGSQEQTSSGFQALADQNGFVIAWPDGIDNAWNIGPCCTKSRDVDDLGFAKAIVAEVETMGCIDTKRIYATGFSMGGGFSHYLACNAADIFAAVTPSSFDLLEDSEEPCHPSRPISVLSFRGTSDTVVPYAGGASTPPNGCCSTIHFLGAVGTLNKWAMLDGCTGDAMTSGSTQMFMTCSGGVQVGLYTMQGGSHMQGPADQAWAFLKTKTLP
jgi:polyhydroxybutyrate depolymerase